MNSIVVLDFFYLILLCLGIFSFIFLYGIISDFVFLLVLFVCTCIYVYFFVLFLFVLFYSDLFSN